MCVPPPPSSWCACGEIQCHRPIQRAFLLPAGRPAAFVTTAFHVTTHHLLPTFLYILSKSPSPSSSPSCASSSSFSTSFSPPSFPPMIIIPPPLTPYPFSPSSFPLYFCYNSSIYFLFIWILHLRSVHSVSAFDFFDFKSVQVVLKHSSESSLSHLAPVTPSYPPLPPLSLFSVCFQKLPTRRQRSPAA